ncbi:MAG: FliH/SctL family protein [Candidatus Baltobacteraceae bacterium]
MGYDEFIALDRWFERTGACARSETSALLAPAEPAVAAEADTCVATGDESCEEAVARVLGESARWYARLDDALDAACTRLLRDIAAGVLARELQLAPSEIASIIENIRAQMLGEPLCVRLHPDDAARWSDASLPCRRDDTLAPGDALVELREGSIDARFGVRLQAVLDACTP